MNSRLSWPRATNLPISASQRLVGLQVFATSSQMEKNVWLVGFFQANKQSKLLKEAPVVANL
jgi:hypothetical protein